MSGVSQDTPMKIIVCPLSLDENHYHLDEEVEVEDLVGDGVHGGVHI